MLECMEMTDDAAAPSPFPRLVTSGKWLRAGEVKWQMRGVSYGPFRPNSLGEPFPEEAAMRADLVDIQRLGFNTVRLYELPTEAVLRVATELGLRLLCGIPWTEHVDFLRDRASSVAIEDRVREAVQRLQGESCVVGFLVGNEIEKTLVRWMRPARVQAFLERLIELGREIAPEKLFSYATYPSTEYLIPRNADFLAVNVYLEQPEALAAYLQRLQNLAGNKPLLITEFGLDRAAHGAAKQVETARWFYQECSRAAVAGTVWFSYTDEWYRGGEAVVGWQFGWVDAQRRQVCHDLASQIDPASLDSAAGKAGPRISVIVCTYNGTATLRSCLQSLQKLRHPDFEVLLVDDGSTQDIAGIASAFPEVRYVRQDHAGLSVARNLGASLATGEILAYTDDDCLVDEDWLQHLAAGFDEASWVAVGGPNIPPTPRNRTEAIVSAAPGAPAHVLLSDAEAEHLPGCNLAIRKTALAAIGGFRPVYEVAGDDVDICWRLRQAGGKLRFMPGAMVWHHRRYTVEAYLRQQRGYGHAEALLMRDHPERFGPLGGARWSGGIYGDLAANPALSEGSIYHGPLGQGLFQGIYQAGARCWLDWLGGVLWVGLALLSLVLGQPSVALGILALSGGLALCRFRHLPLPFALNWREKALLLGLCWLQPMLREWARLRGMIRLGARPTFQPALREVFVPSRPRKLTLVGAELAFWSEAGVDREALLREWQGLMEAKGHVVYPDDGWRWFDAETGIKNWFTSALVTVTEHHGQGRCLTRVRCLVRVHSLLLWLFLGCTLVIGLRPWFSGESQDAWNYLQPLAVLGLLKLFAHGMKKHVLIAAERAGLKRHETA